MVATIVFNNNAIDATGMGGGFSSWDLLPNGPVVAPPAQKVAPFTGRVTTLQCNLNDGHKYLYQPEAGFSFQVGEDIKLEGEFSELDDSETCV